MAKHGHVTGLTSTRCYHPGPSRLRYFVRSDAMQQASRRASSAHHRTACPASARIALVTGCTAMLYGRDDSEVDRGILWGVCSLLDKCSHRFGTVLCWLPVNT
ncbi:hypothetical protein LA080_006050 [Diaporthe eres]|nr:hypothetical protein LA080_006050 [Diaporthe eres]